MTDITVIGSFVMDIVAKMERFPKGGETLLGSSVKFIAGGKGINQCVTVARLGGNTQMIGMLGRDDNAKVFRQIMQEENIKSDKVFSCNTPTAVAQVQIDASGQNRICVIPSANYEFSLTDVEKIDEEIKNSKIVLLQLELKLEVVKEIINRANIYGVTVILNPAPAQVLDKEILSKVDYLTPNETELSLLTGMEIKTQEQVVDACQVLCKQGVKNVIVTLGDKGALIVNKDLCNFVSGYKVKAVDTVAAGDSFNGALAVALIENKNLIEAVRFANGMGALTVQSEGAIPSICTRDKLNKFLNENVMLD